MNSTSPIGKIPTSEQINSLPEEFRRYIHDLETRCDPSGDTRRIRELSDIVSQLESKDLSEQEVLLNAIAFSKSIGNPEIELETRNELVNSVDALLKVNAEIDLNTVT